MKISMKKMITLSLFGATSLMALGGEHSYLYKDPRIMGMGGANVAVGGYSTSVFSNPAGLAKISKDEGFVVDILNLGVSATAKSQDMINDIQDASDSGNDSDMVAVLQKYAGDPVHIGLDNYMSVSKNSDAFAWSVGLLAAADANFVTHSNGSTNGSLLETSSRAYGGVILGGAKAYETPVGKLDVGIGVKYITQKSYEGALTTSELVDNNDSIGDKLQDKYEKTSSGIGLDIGVNYYPFQDNFLHPTFGLSILNIGSMEMDDNYGKQPMTVNIGAAIEPEVPYLHKFVLAVDYVDLLNANKVRFYDYNDGNNEVKYTDESESDMIKRLRIGTHLGLINSTYFSAALNLGLYQGAYTAGVDLAITVLKINFATYEEQIGTGSVSIPDRRYALQLGIGW